jgi:uncharacterized membrane protein YGL010W
MHAESHSTVLRPLDRWFAAYAEDHRHPLNQRLHVLCVPAIVWSIMALLYAVPTPAGFPAALPDFGVAAAIAVVLAVGFWLWLSPPLGVGILACVAAGLAINEIILQTLGMTGLLVTGALVFVIAWIGQFIGHHVEGRRPSFLTDLVYLMIGPPWVLAKAYRALGLAW